MPNKEAVILITKYDWKKGEVSHIPQGTECLFHGATTKEGLLVVAPKSKKGSFYLNRHLPKSLFDL